MNFRKAHKHEFETLYQMGHKEWPKGRSLDQYIFDNQKEESFGCRYVLIDDADQIAASLMLLQFKPYLYGLGSIVAAPTFRKKGFGAELITRCLALQPDSAFLLYSEIGADYYERFGFQALPEEYQPSPPAVCMLKASPPLFERVIREPLPGYF